MNGLFSNLLQYGLPGFSVVLLIIGYNFLNKTHALIINEKGALSKNNFELRRQCLRDVTINARIFMGMSLVFFIGGLLMAIISPSSRINFSISPSEYPNELQPIIRLQEQSIDLEEGGSTVLTIQDDNVLRVENSSLHAKLIAVSQERDSLKNRLSGVVNKVESDNRMVGF